MRRTVQTETSLECGRSITAQTTARDTFWQPVVNAAARSFAVAPMQMPVRDGRELAGEIEGFAREPDGGLMVLPDVSTANNRDLIIALAARHSLPAVYPFRYFAAERRAVLLRQRHGRPCSGGPQNYVDQGFSRARNRPICRWSRRPISNS